MMNYNTPRTKHSTGVVRTLCAIVFCTFTFSWLFFFQADVLAAAQHALSDGQTHYDRLVGGVLITLLLQLLQVAVNAVCRLRRRWHALTYVPSFLLLAALSDVSEGVAVRYAWGAWVWVFPLLLVVWLAAVALARSAQPFESETTLAHHSWRNLVQMGVMMAFVGSAGNTNAVFHYKAHAEACLLRGDVDEALRTGRRSLETDASLTMLRIYALSRRGQLGEQLFRYALAGTSADVLPGEGQSRLLFYPADSIYRHLGARPGTGVQVLPFLRQLASRRPAPPAARDYLLCAHLLDRDLDAFVSRLAADGLTADSACQSLPRHYREALTLYTHTRGTPLMVYHDNVMDEDFANYRELESAFADSLERRGRVRQRYEHTYWFYYDYCR